MFFTDCASHQQCIPIDNCPQAKALLTQVDDTSDINEKFQLIRTLKDISCGNNTVCCDIADRDGSSSVGIVEGMSALKYYICTRYLDNLMTFVWLSFTEA